MIFQYQKMQQRTPVEGNCRNHPDTQAPYFLTDQPWITFCPECALNVALFGKSISKNHSAEQLTHKSSIHSWYNKISTNLQQISDNKKVIDQAIIFVQQNILEMLVESIKKVDEHVEKLYDLRESLKKAYNEMIENKMSEFYDRQTKIAVNEIKMKKQIEEIESNAENLIQGKTKVSISKKIQNWTQIMQENKKIIIPLNDIDRIYMAGKDIDAQIKHKLEELSSLKLYLPIFMDQSASKENNLTTLHQSQISENSKGPQTRLKLRSHSKTNPKKQRNSLSFVRKSLRDSTNLSTLSAFQY